MGSTFEKDIKELGPREAYKYLGIEESHDIVYKNKKETLKKEYLGRVRIVLGTELSATNKIQVTGPLVVRVLRYSFGNVNWRQKELQKLDRKTRKLLTIHGQHHPQAVRRMVHAHTPNPVYEQEDVTVLWNQAVHTDREVTVNRPAIQASYNI